MHPKSQVWSQYNSASSLGAQQKKLGVSKIFNADQSDICQRGLSLKLEKRQFGSAAAGKKNKAIGGRGDSSGEFERTTRLRTQRWKEVRAIEDATGVSIFGNTTAWWNELLQLQFLAQYFAQRPDMGQAVLLLLDDLAVIGPLKYELDEAIKGQDAWPVDRLPKTSGPRETAADDDPADDDRAETIRAGYSRAHMRTEKVQPAISELIAELESLHVVDSTFGDIGSDDDFDR
uniref:AlNc14C66G4676 protein n=1 Tax=Albugo laibachii Nc14 TaxID=890382 RepID=F0WDF6_9STRA|nr:AlNc14C66G4676 [Albugo laibachii Nc14]|eukprot:CCA19228.1 AlNc14C66G4676 [Albugo laibachii Nc14]